MNDRLQEIVRWANSKKGYFEQRHRERKRRQYLKYKNQIKAHCANMRTRFPEQGTITKEDIAEIYRVNVMANGVLTCYLCKKPIGTDKRIESIDHKIPLYRNGPNLPQNIEICCWSCNVKKGKKTLQEYLGISK